MINSFKMILALVMTVVLVPQFSQAKKPARKPSQVEAQPIKIQTVYGDKITLFEISKVKTKGLIKFSNNTGAKNSKEISLKDYDFLIEKISKIPGTSNNKTYCDRSFITIEFEGRELLGCIGAPNVFAHEVQEITNLISLLF